MQLRVEGSVGLVREMTTGDMCMARATPVPDGADLELSIGQGAGTRIPVGAHARSGEVATIAELAERERIAPSYMTRVLRPTLLAPDIVEAILDGKHGPEITLAQMLNSSTVEWTEQANNIG